MTKARAASENPENGKTPTPGEQATTAEFPALPDEPSADDSEDLFKEIPTVANRSSPTVAGPDSGAPVGPLTPPPEGAGAYRILRPSTSDVIETPAAPAKADTSGAKRTILGATRKPK